ncbi:MAG TPA: BNR-4 repeat-containing protein [Polyangiaceae bacterium]
MNRLILALAPIVLGACSSDTAGTDTTASGGTPTAGPVTGTGTTSPATTSPGTTGTTGGMGMAAASTTGGSSTTGGAVTTTTGSSSTTGSSTTDGGTTGPMTCPYTPPEDPATFPDGWTAGEAIVFNENGGWTWYNDERVVVDAEAGKIIVSSARSSASSQSADTNIDAVIHDIATGTNDKMALGSLSYSDDHNNGGIVITAPGEYFVAWAHHNVDCNTYWRNYNGGAWSERVTHTWGSQGCPWNGSDVTYNNPWHMSSEGKFYNFIRSVETSPNFLVSEDNGQTWSYGGRLTASPQQGYNAGYYKYWGNGVDRIDFFATEAHPRDANTSVFHGYIKGGKTYDSFDQEIDDNLHDTNAPGITEFTTVFQAGGTIDGVALNHLWNFDIARYDDGTIGVLWMGREGGGGKDNPNPNHRVLYSRFDGTEWKSTYLVRGGRTLYRNRSDWWEEDYLGGAALDPDDPHVIYVSTPIDPRDDSTDLEMHEIWKGVTCDDGASFSWTPITMNSPNENLRPVVPKWDAQNTAVLWFQGNYQTAQMYTAKVMGIISQR